MTGALAWTGVVGPAGFVAVFLVLGVVKPGYDARARFVSEGSIGELGWIQIVNFVVFGTMLLAFAAALWNSYGNEASGRTGAGLMAAVGAGLILAGVFVTDPGTKIVSRHGLVHVIASMVVFGGLMLACLAFAWRLHANGRFAAYSVATSLHPDRDRRDHISRPVDWSCAAGFNHRGLDLDNGAGVAPGDDLVHKPDMEAAGGGGDGLGNRF